jgi:type IV pilus assembly protein PilM
VEPKKVPDIVKFEAVQQIPFPIDEVEWDYQTFTSADTPEIEVGIFAITRERVQQRLGLYAEVGMSPEVMTLSPVSVFNALAYDLTGVKQEGPVVFLDIGTQATDVIVSEAGRCWIRTFPLGGTHFTEAIASAFKLSYSKAEKLKLEASDSKYAKQIMQAMRPVFSDLLQDLQRSIGYYQSLHREHELKTMIGLGSTFKIPGLRKFLAQQLQIEALRLDEYKRIAVTGREAAAFAENTVNMATAYGLALQGVGLAPIDANLVPVKTLRGSMWQSKTKWFAAAAAIMLLASGAMLIRPMLDRSAMQPVPPSVVSDVIKRGNELRSRFDTLKASSDVGHTALNMVALFDHRTIWPWVLADTSAALKSSDPQAALLGGNLESILAIPAAERNLVLLEELNGEYMPPSDGKGSRRVRVTMNVQLSHDRPVEFLNNTVAAWLRANAEPAGDRANVPYRIIPESITTNPTMLSEHKATATGEAEVRAATGGPGPKANRPPAAGPGPRQNTAPINSAPGGRGLAVNVGGEAAPGSGDGPTARGGGEGTTGGTTGGNSRPGGPRGVQPPRVPPTVGGSGAAESGRALLDIERDAPIPNRPVIYPVDAAFYRIPISFELEIIGPKPAPNPDATAFAQDFSGGVS